VKVPDDVLSQILLGVPNFAIAVFTIYWCFRALDKQAEHQRQVIDKILDLATTVRANQLHWNANQAS
jgi:hypothetical protein